MPRLTGEVLAEVVHRKGATAGSLDGWGWRNSRLCRLLGFMVLLVSCLRWRIPGFGRRVCWMPILL